MEMQSNGQRRRDVGGPLGLHCEACYAARSLNSIALLRNELQHSIAHGTTPSHSSSRPWRAVSLAPDLTRQLARISSPCGREETPPGTCFAFASLHAPLTPAMAELHAYPVILLLRFSLVRSVSQRPDHCGARSVRCSGLTPAVTDDDAACRLVYKKPAS